MIWSGHVVVYRPHVHILGICIIQCSRPFEHTQIGFPIEGHQTQCCASLQSCIIVLKHFVER